MIPILYSPNETAFDTNGIGVLRDAIECRVREALNGSYELTLRYPEDGIHSKAISNRAIILAKPNPVAEPQPFRIYRRLPSSHGSATIRARHIAYDLTGNVVSPFSANGAPAALIALKENSSTDCLFDFWTDKDAPSAMTVRKPASIWSLLGGMEGSVLDCFGGEYEFDRFMVKLWTRRGSDPGVSIRYGKNLTSLEQDENCANCYTGIYPFWASADESAAQVVLLPERILHADGKYDHTRILPVDFSYEWTEAPTEEMLRTRAEKYLLDNQIGVPDVSLKVQYVPLDKTSEYAGRVPIERVVLGDTVSVEFPKMGVPATARIVETDFDVLNEVYVSTTVGRAKASISATIAQQNKESHAKPDVGMAQHIAAQLASSIVGAHGGSVRMLDVNGDGLPDEIYIADNPDPAQATKVWRWNYQGWAASRNGYSGPFLMGASLEDGIMAHVIKAANLVAGTIISADGSTFFLDLNSGVLKANFTELSINGNSVQGAIDTLRTTLKLQAEGLDIAVTNLRKNLEGKADQEQVTELTEHFRFAENGLTISNSATGMGINVSEKKVAFTGGKDPTTVITPNAMETTNLTVGVRLDLGDFSLIPRTSGNLSLRYTGG